MKEGISCTMFVVVTTHYLFTHNVFDIITYTILMEWQFQDSTSIGGYRLYECLLLDNMMLDKPCPKGVLNNWSGETSPYLRVLQVLCYYINLEKVTHTQKILLTSSLSLRITTYTTLDCGSFKIQGCFLKLRRKRCVGVYLLMIDQYGLEYEDINRR